MLLILVEAFFIFRPMLKDSKEKTRAIDEISELREEEKTYAASQVKEANKRILSLRRLAIKLKNELERRSDIHSEEMSGYLSKHAALSSENEKLKIQLLDLKAQMTQYKEDDKVLV